MLINLNKRLEMPRYKFDLLVREVYSTSMSLHGIEQNGDRRHNIERGP